MLPSIFPLHLARSEFGKLAEPLNSTRSIRLRCQHHDKMPPEDDNEVAWDADWDDNESNTHETQQILHNNNVSAEEIEDEIRANLTSKITSSLHAYKIAGIALIITLISFTINTVPPSHLGVNVGIRTICSGDITLGETLLYAVPLIITALIQIFTPFIMVIDGTFTICVSAIDKSEGYGHNTVITISYSFVTDDGGTYPF
jgi:hypothetical protein